MSSDRLLYPLVQVQKRHVDRERESAQVGNHVRSVKLLPPVRAEALWLSISGGAAGVKGAVSPANCMAPQLAEARRSWAHKACAAPKWLWPVAFHAEVPVKRRQEAPVATRWEACEMPWLR